MNPPKPSDLIPAARSVAHELRERHLWAGGTAMLLGLWLGTRVFRLGSADWQGQPNLPYAGALAWMPFLLGAISGLCLVFAAQIWTDHAGLWPPRRRWRVAAGAAGGIFVAGLIALLASVPPWPRIAKANRAAHFCVNELKMDWCQHLVASHRGAIGRLPLEVRRAFAESGNSAALVARLRFARLSEEEREEVREEIDELHQLFLDGENGAALAGVTVELERLPGYPELLELRERISERIEHGRAIASQGKQRAPSSARRKRQ